MRTPLVPRSRRRNVLCLLSLVACAAGCHGKLGAASATRDVATNSTADGSAGAVYLYVRAGQMISRTKCPDGLLAVNYNRAHCPDGAQSVLAQPFIDALSVGVGDSITVHAKNVVDLYAGVAAAQNELIQILTVAPAVQAQVQALRQQLTDSDTKIAALQVSLNDYDRQIAAVRAQLAARGNVDLNIQLGQLLDERDKVLGQQNQAKTAEQDRRAAFISANSSALDPETFNDVKAQMDAAAQQLASEQASLTSAMQEVADLNKTIAHVSDPTFTFDVLEGTAAFAGLKPFTRRFQGIFDRVYAAAAQAAAAQAAAAQLAAAQAAVAQAVAAQAAAAQAAADQAAAAQAAANLSAAEAAAEAAARGAAQDAAAQAAVAPAFAPTSFLLGSAAAVTFAAPLPAWAVKVAVEIDGRERLYAAGAQITLEFAGVTVGAHTLHLVLVSARGQRSQPSPVHAIDLHMTPGWVDVTLGGSCASNWDGCAYKDSATGLLVTKKFPQVRWFAAANACESLSFAGLAGGWYLPRVNELQQLPRDIMLALSGDGHDLVGGANKSDVWSSSANSGDPNDSPLDRGLRDALVVDFAVPRLPDSFGIDTTPDGDWTAGYVCFRRGG